MSGRALVIGLDGMPRTLLRELAGSGVLPRIAELLTRGSCAELLAPVPEISSTSWATFLTGVNPGRHGVYGFVDLLPDSYETYFPNVADLKSDPVWAQAERQGLTTLCLNVPGTYPAPRIQGVLVSGFVAPVLERAVQPARLIGPLRALDYELDVEVGDVAADPVGFIQRVRRALTARTKTFRHLLRNEPWDLAVAVITETDRLQHFLWRDVADAASPLHDAVMDFYGLVDDSVGEVLDSADDTDEIFLVSDHGFGPAEHQFFVNDWLRDQGWLSGLTEAPVVAELDSASRVFALDPARFYVHRKERFGRGTLGESDADELIDALAEALLALRRRDGRVGPDLDGPPVVGEVRRRSQIYSGPLLDQAPDLVAIPAPGVQLRGGWRPGATHDVLTGTHTRDNAVFYASCGIAQDRVDMADVAPTVLGALGVRPGGLDGRDVRAGHRPENSDQSSGG